MLSPIKMPGVCQMLLLLSCLCRCQRDVLAQFPRMEHVVLCAGDARCSLLCAGLQVCAASRAAGARLEQGLER